MSSPVLARKYRPRDFDALVGQEHVVQALANALKQRRLHHAYLFTGTRGVGKTTVSRILAKSLNCVGPDGSGDITAQPCGVCAACSEIDAGRFVDYVELDAASNRGVDEISQLLAQAVYKPVLGRFKVYMIDEVHMLSTTAFNAMLKTLEEPPDYLKFVLATTDPQKVPATVLSRCLQFNLRPMAPQTILEHLTHVLGEEAIPSEPVALRLLARAARGSMRDALSLTDQAIAFGAGSLGEDSVRRMLGAVDSGHAVRLVEAISRRDGAALVAGVNALRAQGLSAAGTLDELCELLQRMAVEQAVAGAEDAGEPGAADVRRLATVLPADETQLLYSIVLHGRADLAVSPDEYSGLVMILLRMLAFSPCAAPQDRPTAGPMIEPAAASASSPKAGTYSVPNRSTAVSAMAPARALPTLAQGPTTPTPMTAAASPAISVGGSREAALSTNSGVPAALRIPVQPVDSPAAPAEVCDSSLAAGRSPTLAYNGLLGDRWIAVVRQLVDAGAIGAMVRELAMQAQCLAIDEQGSPSVWQLRVERDMLRAPAQVDKLQHALGVLLQVPVRIEVELGVADDSPARREQAERERAQHEAELLIENDPVVRSLLSEFKGARIVPGSIKPH